jgi:hypothetical protein
MGSTGSGHLSDYSNKKPTSDGANNGGSSGDDKCGKAFPTSLDEVSRCTYFTTHGSLPPIGTPVSVVFNGVRIAVTTLSGEELGYLPTSFNYIRLCINEGRSYGGSVTSSRTIPTANVFVDITPL